MLISKFVSDREFVNFYKTRSVPSIARRKLDEGKSAKADHDTLLLCLGLHLHMRPAHLASCHVGDRMARAILD